MIKIWLRFRLWLPRVLRRVLWQPYLGPSTNGTISSGCSFVLSMLLLSRIKSFRWDTQGIYRDCFFPFPCQHLLGGEAIVGKSVKDVLPKKGERHSSEGFKTDIMWWIPARYPMRASSWTASLGRFNQTLSL